MMDPSEIVCPSCGESFAVAAPLGEPAVCPHCRTQCNSAVPDDRLTRSIESESAETIFLNTPEPSPRSSKRTASVVPSSVGRFQVQKVLGSGGFGTVYQAHDPLLDRVVALKVPRFNDDDRQEKMFLREAKAAARLRHPNIVAVFECGMAGDQPYIASELVDGTPLTEFLKAGRIETEQAVEIVRQIAEAIEYAHEEGIVHRDLKPDNIMMSRSTRPQVMDFGLARSAADSEKSLTSEGSIVGTPAYMSPEQAQGESDVVGPKSDQYSVGVMLYLMLSGRLPYRGKAWSIISKVADPNVQPMNLRAVRREIPRDLEACCLKAMEKDPDRRYENLGELADDLQNWLEARPLLARPIGPRERFTRWCGRNRLIAGMMAVITGLILSALIVGYVLAFNFRDLAEYANDRADAAVAAKRHSERMLIDTYTEWGLEAGRRNKSQEAVLWFGNAAAGAAEYPRREWMNRIRFEAWLGRTPVLVRLFSALGHGHKSLKVHPTAQYILSEQYGQGQGECQIWDVASGEPWSSPWKTPISLATWSADGSLLALGSETEVRVFRFPSGEELNRWQNEDQVTSLRLTSNGNRIAIGGRSSIVMTELADPTTKKIIVPTPAPVVSVTWNPAGDTLAVLCSNKKVYLWREDSEVAASKQLPTFLTSVYESEPARMEFIGDNRLVVPEKGKALVCRDVTSGEKRWSWPCKRSDINFAVAPDGTRVAIVDQYQVLEVDADTGEQIGESMDHPNLVYDLAYDSTGKQLLTGCGDQYARIFSLENNDLVSSMRHGDIVHRVAWFPDRQACVTVHWKADLVRVWKLGTAQDDGFTQDLRGGVMHVKWNEDGSRFLPCGFDLRRAAGAPRVLNTSDGKPVGKPISFPGRVSDGCFAAGSQHVFVGGSATVDPSSDESDKLNSQDLSQPGLIVAANVDTGEPAFSPIETDANVIALESSPRGNRVVALCHDHSLLIIDPEKGTVLKRHESLAAEDFFYGFVIRRRIAFSPTGDRFVVWGSRVRTAEVRSADDGALLFTVSHTNDSNVTWLHDVVFSPDGKTMATCSADQSVQLWNADNGDKLPITLWHTGWVFSAEFSRDGKRLLTTCVDRQARLWDLQNPDKPMLITPAQNDEVYATCFLPGDEAFLIGLRNGEVSAWDAELGKMISPSTIEPDQRVTYELALSPDQSRVIIVSRDAHVRGFSPSRWQPSVDPTLSREELRHLAETIASQELLDGVLIGLTNEKLVKRWTQLYQDHAEEEIFRWQNMQPAKVSGTRKVGTRKSGAN